MVLILNVLAYQVMRCVLSHEGNDSQSVADDCVSSREFSECRPSDVNREGVCACCHESEYRDAS